MMIRGGRRVLVFSAHAADFCSRAGGAIIRLVDAGSTVLVYDMTYGEKCESPALWARDPKPTIDEVKGIRKQEMEAAAKALGASIACFDFGDSPLVIGSERRQQVMEVFREFQPDLVLTHWKDDILHPDHVETTAAVLWASRYCFRPGIELGHPPCPAPEVVCYETTLGTAPVANFMPNVYVDITEVLEQTRRRWRTSCRICMSISPTCWSGRPRRSGISPLSHSCPKTTNSSPATGVSKRSRRPG